MIESVPQGTISLLGASLIYKYHMTTLSQEDNYIVKYWKLFGCMGLLGLVSSVLTYPLDTIKRQIQVNGSKGYSYEYLSITQAYTYMLRNVKEMYR